MSLRIYSLAHKKEVTVTALIDPAKVEYGAVNPVTKSYKVGSGAPAAYKGHKGIDTAGSHKSPIYAVHGGVVRVSKYDSSAGNYVSIGETIDGKLYVFLYMHMVELPKVKKGQVVKKGDLLGYQGSTGNSTGSHLHFGVKVNDKYIDPYNWLTVGSDNPSEVFDMTYETGVFKVTVDSLRIRNKPSTSSEVLGTTKKGDTYDVASIHMDDKGGTWGKIGHNQWICFETIKGEKYVERVGDIKDNSTYVSELEATINKIKEIINNGGK